MMNRRGEGDEVTMGDSKYDSNCNVAHVDCRKTDGEDTDHKHGGNVRD